MRRTATVDDKPSQASQTPPSTNGQDNGKKQSQGMVPIVVGVIAGIVLIGVCVALTCVVRARRQLQRNALDEPIATASAVPECQLHLFSLNNIVSLLTRHFRFGAAVDQHVGLGLFARVACIDARLRASASVKRGRQRIRSSAV